MGAMTLLEAQALYRGPHVVWHQVSVHLRDTDRTVAEQLRYRHHVHAFHDQVAGERMTQAMDFKGLVLDPRSLKVVLEFVRDEIGTQWEQPLPFSRHGAQDLSQWAVKGHNPALPRLRDPEHDGALSHINVFPRKV